MAIPKTPSFNSWQGMLVMVVGVAISLFVISKVGFLKSIAAGKVPTGVNG